MTNLRPRLFIQSDDAFDPRQIAHWVELKMTKTLQKRIGGLYATLVREELIVLTTRVQARWSLEPGWEIDDESLLMEVMEFGLALSGDARPIDTQFLKPSANRQVRATLLWSSLEEFFERFHNKCDALETSPDLAAWDSQKWDGEQIFTTNTQWFLRSVKAYLKQQKLPALKTASADDSEGDSQKSD
jgi:hypothetical protein